MFGNDEFVGIFGAVPPGDDEALIQVVSGAVRAGIAIVMDHPGEKRPMCVLSAKDRNAADRKAQETAFGIRDERWHMRKHDCGLHHALTVASLTGTEENPSGDPTKVRAKVSTMVRRLTKLSGGAQPNIGIELGRSRLLVVDVDTQAELEGFEDDWRAQPLSGDDVWSLPGMTVRSPGKQNVDGEWVHKDGGHYWFTIPDDVELPAGTGALKAESGWVAMWSGHQVLVPPSARAEGPYELIGQISEAPEWLIAKILHEAHARMDRVKNRGPLPDGSSDIDRWSAGMPWADLLGVDGWTDTGLPDRCSCPIWTAPGPHSSPKSATAHDIGCSQYDASPGHAPLHIWTDNPPDFLQEAVRQAGTKTFSKLQYVAWRDHSGAARGALNELGLNVRDEEYPGFGKGRPLDGFNPVDVALRAKLERDESHVETSVDPRPPGLFLQPGSAPQIDPEVDEAHELTRAEVIRSLMISSAELDSIEDPEYLIQGFLDRDTIARMTGKSGHGKTFVMLDMSCHVATGKTWHGFRVNQGLVVYMVAEGTRGFKKRIRAWEAKYHEGQPISDDRLLILPVPIQATGADWAPFRTALEALRPALVVLDTQARITVGVDENDAKEMGIFVERLESVRHATSACVLAVHHLGHAGEHGRGSTAVLGALGSEIRVKKGDKGFLTIETEKQKDDEEKAPLAFRLESVDDSVVPVPDGWIPVDPDADPMTIPAPPVVHGPGVTAKSSVRNRLAAIIWSDFWAEGTTRTEAQSSLKNGHPVYGIAGRSSADRAWSALMGKKAVDAVSAADAEDGIEVKARPAVPGFLVQQRSPVTGNLWARWTLDPEEAARLGLPDPLRPAQGPDAPPAGKTP